MSPSVSVRLLLTQSDERLVGYARAGHERAFEALVQRYRRQLLGYCRRLLLSEEHAEDALQQALLQAWVALRDGAEVRAARPWLYRIVHNAAVNALRVAGYDYCKLSESLSGAGAPQEDLDRRIAVREALAGLAALPDMQREALLRTAVEGRSHQQVASDLGLSEPALRGLVYRARAAMRAAAGAIVPPPLLSWALDAGTRGAPALEGVAGVGAGGSAGLAGLLVKGSAAAVTAGALAGGLVAAHTHTHKAPALDARDAEHSSGHTAAPAHAPATAVATVAQPGPAASLQPVALTRPFRRGASAPGGVQAPHPAGRGDGRFPVRAHAPRSLVPAWRHHLHGDGSEQQGEPPRQSFGTHDGGGPAGSTHEGHAEASGPTASGPGDREQKDGGAGGAVQDGGGSLRSGHDGAGDGPSAQASGGGELGVSGAGEAGGGGATGQSGHRQPSEGWYGGDSPASSTGATTTGTSGSKDSAGLSESLLKD